MRYLKLKPAILLTFCSAAVITGCATTLANRTPIDIASNSVRRTDTLSGVNEILAPRVKAFGAKRAAIRGTTQLRTAGPFTNEKGFVSRGGAYLDVLINYATATPNPQEARLYDTVRWPGGDVALLADFGSSVLDCRQDVRESYTPAYSGYYGSYGYGYGYGSGHGHSGGGHGGDGDSDPMPDTPNPDAPTVDEPLNPDVDVPRRPRRPRVRRPEDGPSPVRPPRRPVAITGASKPDVSRRRPVMPVASQPASKPAPQPVSRPAPKPAPRPASTSKSKPSPKRDVARVRTPKLKREMNYYPRDPYYNGGYRDVSVRFRCDRQETLRVFIPRERLDASEDNGLFLYLQPKNGREEKLILPPNYIRGFKLAAFTPEGKRLTIQGGPVRLNQRAQARTPYSASPEAAPNVRKPIIYGSE